MNECEETLWVSVVTNQQLLFPISFVLFYCCSLRVCFQFSFFLRKTTDILPMQNAKCFKFYGTRKELSHLSAVTICSLYIQYFFICVHASMLSFFPSFFLKLLTLVHFNFEDMQWTEILQHLWLCYLTTCLWVLVFEQHLSAVPFFSKYLKTPNPIKNKKGSIKIMAEDCEFQKNTRVACNKQQDINRVPPTMQYNCHSGLDK